MLNTLSYSYDIGSFANEIVLDPSAVTATPAPSTPCGSIDFEIIYKPSGTPDPSIFTFDGTTFRTYTTANSNEGTYEFLLNTRYNGYSNP